MFKIEGEKCLHRKKRNYYNKRKTNFKPKTNPMRLKKLSIKMSTLQHNHAAT